VRVAIRRTALGLLGAGGILAIGVWPGTPDPRAAAVLSAPPRVVDDIKVSESDRVDALRRAQVWREPRDRSIAALVSTPDPDGSFTASPLECRYQAEQAHGTTPKFDCVLATGEVVKVKYGLTRERQAEVAASRLLARLGFGADDMFIVPRVRCFGCPRRPFEVSWMADRFHLGEVALRRFSPARYIDFEWTSVERRFGAPSIESAAAEGWAFYELASEDATRVQPDERDALRLAALLLAHWDNKAENQRLVCLDAPVTGARCEHPFAFIQDLGATFGPNKVNLESWRDAAIWQDAARCTVSMRAMPYEGGTFRDGHIGEGGRQRLLQELRSISQADAQALFGEALFESPAAWAATFVDKVRQISAAGPCPPAGR
jgi:hypothetical protein